MKEAAPLTLLECWLDTIRPWLRASPPGGAWIATVRDPAGNAIGLYQEGVR